MTLHVFTNGSEFYAARDMGHLAELVEKNTGVAMDHEDNLGDDCEWSMCRDHEPCIVWDEDSGERAEKTFAEWAQEKSPSGFLFATDF
jgi:hypothetical protein